MHRETQLKEFHARKDMAKDDERQGKAYMRKYFTFYGNQKDKHVKDTKL